MVPFACDVCGQLLAFDNSVCLRCGTGQGWSPRLGRLIPLEAPGGDITCANRRLIGCNWLLPDDEVPAWGGLCASCRLTRTRPPDGDTAAMAAWERTEAAKRRLVRQVLLLGLPVAPKLRGTGPGLTFDLLSSAAEQVRTGHADGVVTIDLAEGEDPHREAVRLAMGEPYRTLLGHLRHEVGHYYWQVLVADGPTGLLPRVREVFGDDRRDYAAALDEHYASPAPQGWQDRHISVYATAHPWEDWAETFAHYLHIRDTLETAAGFGLSVAGPAQVGEEGLAADPGEVVGPLRPGTAGVSELLERWLPLTYALNEISRSMGRDPLYPFVLAPAVVGKLGVVHDAVVHAAAAGAGSGGPAVGRTPA